jgi:hypothetical protein
MRPVNCEKKDIFDKALKPGCSQAERKNMSKGLPFDSKFKNGCIWATCQPRKLIYQ